MFGHEDSGSQPVDRAATTPSQSWSSSAETSSGAAPYRPSTAFRRALNRGQSTRGQVRRASTPSFEPGAAPSLKTVIAAALAIGVVSGLLELAVLVVQLRLLQYVDWSTLMVSRHAGWMIPITGASLVVVLTTILVGPALAWVAWRRRVMGRDNAHGLAWDWAGWVLGTLLLLGPLLTIRGFHFAAPMAVAVGVGFRGRRFLVRPSPGWPRRAYGAAGIAMLVLGCHLAGQCRPSTPEDGPAGLRSGAGAPNLLWIVLDTLRADRMSLYGYERPTTPALEAWARHGITFDLAHSAAPWTLPSHMTMFTGLLPSEHGACIDRPYSGSSPTLAEHLRAQGYTTAGIVANVRMCNTAYGVGRGFDWYVDYPCKREISLKAAMSNTAVGSGLMEIGRRLCLPIPLPDPFYYRRAAPAIAAEGRAWLDSLGGPDERSPARSPRPFFLFLNFMDVHGPYLPTTDAPCHFWTGPVPSKQNARPEDGWQALQALEKAGPDQKPRRRQELDQARHRLGDLYDDCLGGLDAHLGRYLDGLREAGLLANTWIVVTADHGEHFGEHGQFGHGSSLYNELTHVPLVLIPPLGTGSSEGDPYAALRNRRIPAPVSHSDLPRTITELLLPDAENPFPGRSLARHWLAQGPQTPDPVIAQLDEPRLKGKDFRTSLVTRIDSIVAEDRVLIEYSDHPPELFALMEDPAQRRNLAGVASEQARLERLRQKLAATRQQSDRP